MLENDDHLLIALEKFNKQRCSEYTKSLAEQQNLEAANKAWKDGNYPDVIKYLKMIDKVNLSVSFMQKYKIAQQRLIK